ncbi:MAG: zf-HC2 domain-containing protein [Lachnospiraceae bacterium]|nr:zf-HC2 domain-containing protein [Lachnospiraceae bacterium]
MERELACEIVKDLLPLYVDEMVSDVSKKSIENHLEHCVECNEIYQNMAFHLEMETQPTEVQDVKRFLKKTKKMYLLYGLGCLSFIAILVCMIVDLAMNKGVTWSLITGSSCLFADILIYVLSTCKKNKGCITMAVISIGTLSLLSVIQITRYCLMGSGTVWIFRYGLPILLLWLLVLWLPVLTRTILKWNIWDCIALFMLLVIVGNYATKLITGDYVWNDVLHMQGFAGNALGEVIGIILFGIIGRIKKWKK